MGHFGALLTRLHNEQHDERVAHEDDHDRYEHGEGNVGDCDVKVDARVVLGHVAVLDMIAVVDCLEGEGHPAVENHAHHEHDGHNRPDQAARLELGLVERKANGKCALKLFFQINTMRVFFLVGKNPRPRF